MAPRSPTTVKPTAPVLTPEQKRYRVERFSICIQRLEAFDPEKVHRRFGVPEVVTLEAGIDKALVATFGYGTPSYLRYNLAARLDAGPHLTSAALQYAVAPALGGQASYDNAVEEARRYYSEGRSRSLALLREAIAALEGATPPARPIFTATQHSVATWVEDTRRSTASWRFDLKAAFRRVGHWWRARRARRSA